MHDICIPLLLALEDERKDETDKGKRLDQCETDEHRRTGVTGGLGLASHRLDRRSEHETDTDARADRGEAVNESTGERLEPLVGNAADPPAPGSCNASILLLLLVLVFLSGC